MIDQLLSIKDLSVQYNLKNSKLNAVRNVNLEINSGEIVGMVGESGSGKSVTARSIMKLNDVDNCMTKGEILFNNDDILKKNKRQIRNIRGNQISMIFQNPMTSLNPLYTIGDQISEIFKYKKNMKKNEAREETLKLLELVKIPSPIERLDQYPFQFSGGMLQRIMIAIALACKPRLLIADEPTTALDVTIQDQILTLIKNLQQKYNMSVLIITHDMGVVAEICDRVSVMYAGEIVESANVNELFSNPKHPYTQGLIDAIPKLGAKGKILKPIIGTPPDLRLEIKGCPFAERCQFKKEKCLSEKPQLRSINEQHMVACHYA